MSARTEHCPRNMAATQLPGRNYIEECQERTYLSRKEKLTIQEDTRPHGARKPGNNYQNESLTRPDIEVNVGETPRDSKLRPTRRTPLGQLGRLAGTRQKSNQHEIG